MSTLKVTNIENPSTSSGGIDIDTSGHVTVDGLAMPSAGPLSNRNKIINGDMRIDQRNAGASVTPTGSAYTLDRWALSISQASKVSVQQSSTSGFGFNKYALLTVASTATVGSTDFFQFAHPIEGNNVADLEWGTSNAKTVTLSFYAYSSVAGTFGGSLKNYDSNRSYPFTYSLPASTWTPISITVPGDTTGTWYTDHRGGITVVFSIGMGSTYSGTAGSWASANYGSATGATSLMGTSGATFALTGVQLEAGSVATPFEHRSYGDELAKCQRYYQKSYSQSVVPGSASAQAGATMVYIPATGNTLRYTLRYVTPMRAAPNATFYNPETGTTGFGAYEGSGDTNSESITVTFSNENSMLLYNTAMGYTGSFYWQHVLSAEL